MTPLRPPLDEVLDALVHIGRPLLLTRFHERCCVAATRYATRVLDECGYASKARRVWVRTGNAGFIEAARRDVQDADELERLGARFVEIAGDDDVVPDATTRDINAHYVAQVGETLIDLSAGQLNRPKKHIHVPGAVILNHVDGDQNAFTLDLDGGGILLYRYMEGQPPPRGDWKPERTADFVDMTLDALGVRAFTPGLQWKAT